MTKGYTEDLAYIHEAGFGAFAERAAPRLVDLLHRHGITGGLIVDLGCGPGVLAEKLVEHGYDVLGIDISSSMIKLARTRAPSADFKVASFLSAPLPQCVAIVGISESLGYLFDRRVSKQSLGHFFGRAHRALETGGLLIFDLLEKRRGVPNRSAQRWTKGEDWAVLVRVCEDPDSNVLVREITSFRRRGKLYRRTDEVHSVRLLPRDSVARELRSKGFSVKVVRGYGDVRFEPGHVGFVARKK